MKTTLEAQEVEAITGYKRPSDQLEELHRQGFYRARRSRTTGNIILEREHYTFVCIGSRPVNVPRVRVPQLRSA
jgi:hypothetical protein